MAPNRLWQLARAQQPPDADLAECWDSVVRGIKVGWLDVKDLAELLQCLRTGTDFGVEELHLERRGEQLEVRFLGDARTCSIQGMIAQLQQLLELYAAGMGPE